AGTSRVARLPPGGVQSSGGDGPGDRDLTCSGDDLVHLAGDLFLVVDDRLDHLAGFFHELRECLENLCLDAATVEGDQLSDLFEQPTGELGDDRRVLGDVCDGGC